MKTMLPLLLFCSMIAFPETASGTENSPAREKVPALMPIPAKLSWMEGHMEIDSSFRIVVAGKRDARVENSAARFLTRVSRQTGIPFLPGMTEKTDRPVLEVSVARTRGRRQSAIEDESYQLTVTKGGGKLHALTPFGALRGIETFLQLITHGGSGFVVPCAAIEDAPRFPWRGLLIDVCRHWMPIEVVKRNLDAMAAVKMNVLHWHLSEDQGFRVESKRFPRLHLLGSDGHYYTQAQIREVVAYAAERGIRVVPEFDMPGHSTSWFVGYPELSSGPGPYEIERRWGVWDPTMNPIKETTYEFLDTFIGEMTTLFPDQYFHIGGDEVNGNQWNADTAIIAFKKKNNMKDNHDLQAYFNRRVQRILRKHGKTMVGWDEIFHPDLPKDIVIQSWRGQKSLASAARTGFKGILSFGYYLDHIKSAAFHYGIDPMDKDAAALPDDAKKNILGGEACMWAEFVTPENIDSRIWPRNAAIAERLWSPEETKDVPDMYRRLGVVSQRLEYLGVTHNSSYPLMLQRLTDYAPTGPLKALADVVEPVKNYERGRTRQYTSLTPLNRLVDAARPESEKARIFAGMVDEFLADTTHSANAAVIRQQLREWEENHERLQPIARQSSLLAEVTHLSENLSAVARLGREAFDSIRNHNKLGKHEENLEFLNQAGKQEGALLLVIVPSIRKLVEAAYVK